MNPSPESVSAQIELFYVIISIFKEGEFTESVGGVYDISNIDRLGTSEVQQVQCVIDGVNELIQMEKCLEKGGKLPREVPSAHDEAKE